MGVRFLFWPLPIVILMAGCVTDGLFEEQPTSMVPADTFGSAPPPLPITKVSHAPAEEATAQRVAAVGQKLVEANPKIGMRPMFRTVGSPQLEIFHRGTSELVVTEGVVNQCTTDGQLAAVLALELGKMVSEREALIAPRMRTVEREPPIEVRVGNDLSGPNGAVDMTRMAELAPYEHDRNRREQPPPPPPDPRVLAKLYLLKAKIPASELDAAAPILRSAGQNGALEKQLGASPTTQP
jgi:hypothetical protein